MQLPVFENAYLLQSLGWAIANSFWQTGGLWLLYQLITAADKKLPALVKHYLSIALLISSFIWFVFTIVQNYRLLSNGMAFPEMIITEGWKLPLQPFNTALPFLSIAYLVLFFIHTGQFFKQVLFNRFLQSDGLSKAAIDLRLFAKQTALHLGIKKNVRVWLSVHVDVPSVTGFIKPVILLPAAIITQLSALQVEAILLHELAHIKRNDYLINLLQSVVELILFFNPFTVLLGKTAKRERENCCDDWVMNFQYHPYEYAKALLILEEGRTLLQSRFVLTATSGKKNLLLRVKRLFNTYPETNFRRLQKFKLTAVFLLLLGTMVTLFPYMASKPSNDKARVTHINKQQLKSMVKFVDQPKERLSNDVFASAPVLPGKEKIQVTTRYITKKQPVNEPDSVYINAFVNEELLNPTSQVEPMATLVVNKEINHSKFIVTIEEQQSGKKQSNTYYFELNTKDGNRAMKPLMMLNKTKVKAKKRVQSIIQDNLKTPAKLLDNKRITS